MWFLTPPVKLSLALFILKSELCSADNGAVPPISSNSTRTSPSTTSTYRLTSSHSSSSQSSSLHSSSSPLSSSPLSSSPLSLSQSSSSASTITTSQVSSSSTSTATFGTITSAPPWGNQVFPVNTCSVSETDGTFQYTPCNIFAGTVSMSYFPENSGNVTYPSTYYDPTLSITLTSPSIYMIINTLTGDNSCGPLGPTYTNAVISLDLTSVSTLQPYADHTVTTRMGPPQQLILSDLMSGCPGTYATFSTDGAFLNTHPVYGTYNKCHPRFVFPVQLKRLGYPYWMHCGNDDYELGIFDPPAPVPPVSGLLPATTPSVPFTSTPAPASTIPGTPTQPSNTSPAQAVSTPSSPPAAQSSPPAAHEESTSGTPSSEPSSEPSSGPSSTAPSTTSTPASPTSTLPTTITQPSVPSPTTTKAIAVIGTNTIGAVPGSSGVVLPNGSTLHPGSVATVTDSHSQPVVISVASSGVFIGGKTGSKTFIPNPTIPPIPIATLGGNTISAAPEASSIVVGTKTAFMNGPPVTVGGSVIKLTPSGVVVAAANGKSASTFAVPTFKSSSPSASEFVIANMHVTVPPGASKIVIGKQTITYGGDLLTLSNHDVLSLGPAGLVIQMPSGKVSTVAVPASTTAQTMESQTTSVTSAGKSIGSIIASLGGLGNGTASAQSATSSSTSAPLTPSQPPSTTTTSITIPTGSGSHVVLENACIWIAGCFLMALLPWM